MKFKIKRGEKMTDKKYTASALFNNTLKLLGYSDCDGNIELTDRLRNRAIVTVNLVYGDLWNICYHSSDKTSATEFKPIKSLADEIKLPIKVIEEAFLYGLAMHIARSENDGDQQQLFAMLYNAKRASLSKYDKVKNVLPRPE